VDIEAVDPALRGPLRRLPGGRGTPNAFGRGLARLAIRLMLAHKVDGVTVRTAKSGNARVRIYTPSTPMTGAGAGLLWIHGGGYFMGVAKVDDRNCGETARDLGIVVVSAEYRLAPEHPFPAAADVARCRNDRATPRRGA
jgi:acetyl esterase/lipase